MAHPKNSAPTGPKLKILMQMRPNAFTERGGDTVVLDKVSHWLKEFGHTVDIELDGKADPKKYDLVHLYNFCTPDITENFARKCVQAGTPFVATTMYEDWPNYFSQMMAFYISLRKYIELGQPLEHWLTIEESARNVPPAAKQDNSWTAAHAEAVIASGEYEANTLRSHYPDTKRVLTYYCGCEIVDQGIDGELFAAKTGIRDFILCVGRLETRKNQLMILKALEESELPLVFLTGGFSVQPEYDQACRSFRRKGKTFFFDRLDAELLASAFAASRAHVMPSWCELPGIVSLEAARYGTNPVVTNYGTIHDYLGDDAYYCEPNSADSILQAINNAYATPPSKQLKERTLPFTWKNTALRSLEIYQEVLQELPDKTWAAPRTVDTESYDVLLVPSCENHAKVLLPVANKLTEHGHRVSFLSLDEYYDENARQPLAKVGANWKHLRGAFCNGRYFTDIKQRSLFNHEAAQQLEIYFAEHQPDCVVLAHDQEAIEALVVRAAERIGARTVRIQHGLQNAPLITAATRKHQTRPGDSGFDLECFWGEGIAKTVTERGLGGEVVVSGNPRFDVLADWPGYQAHSGTQTVLIATQNYSKHFAMKPAQEIAIYEQLANQLLTRDDVRVLLKTHPQQTLLEAYAGIAERLAPRVELITEGESLEILRKVDLVVTISSSIAIESTLMGIPTARLTYYTAQDEAVFQEKQAEFLQAIKNPNFPQGMFLGMSSVDGFSKYHTLPADGNASLRAAKAIEQVIAQAKRHANDAVETPRASVIIELAEGDALDAVMSCLRPTKFPYEVIVIDRSTQGEFRSALTEQVQDSRIRYFEKPHASTSEALAVALETARSEFILRLDANCVALPGWIERTCNALTMNKEARVALPCVVYRDHQGIPRGVVTPPADATLEKLQQDTFTSVICPNFGFRKSSLETTSTLRGTGSTFDLSLIAEIVKEPQNPTRLSMVEGPLIASQFSSRSYGAALHNLCQSTRLAKPHSSQINKPVMSVLVYHSTSSGEAQKKLERSLDSLTRQDIEADFFEVILFNDGADADAAQMMNNKLSALGGRYLESKARVGRAAARNRMAEVAAGEIIIFIGESSELTPTFLEEHFGAIKLHKNELLVCSGGIEHSDEANASVVTRALQRIHYIYPEDVKPLMQRYAFDAFIGDNVSLPREVFSRFNIRYDEHLKSAWGQDFDLAFKLWREGFRFCHNPRAKISCNYQIAITDIEAQEAEKAFDIASLATRNQELLSYFVSSFGIDQQTLKDWALQIEKNKHGIEVLTNQLTDIQDVVPPNTTQTEIQCATELVQEVANALSMIVEHWQRREAVRLFTAVNG